MCSSNIRAITGLDAGPSITSAVRNHHHPRRIRSMTMIRPPPPPDRKSIQEETAGSNTVIIKRRKLSRASLILGDPLPLQTTPDKFPLRRSRSSSILFSAIVGSPSVQAVDEPPPPKSPHRFFYLGNFLSLSFLFIVLFFKKNLVKI